MNISINEEVVNSSRTPDGVRLTLPEVLTCLIVMMGGNPKDIQESLMQKGYILNQSNGTNGLLVFRKYAELTNSILKESEKAISSNDDLTGLVTTLQSFFPRERKPNEYGVPTYSYRGNKTDLVKRLQKFFQIYGKYSYDDIIRATKEYVSRYQYDKKYLRVLPYFILKDGESLLATELENLPDVQEEGVPDYSGGVGDIITV